MAVVSASIIEFPMRLPRPDDSGLLLCPMCGRNDGFMNVGQDHWAVCHEDHNKWYVGRNLFSTWLYESKEDWEQSDAFLARYNEVEPVKVWRSRR